MMVWSLSMAVAISALVQILIASGLIVHSEKSSFEPSRQASWLDFDIDLAAGIIKVPQTKLSNLKTSLQWAVCGSAIPARQLLASLERFY